MIPPGRSPGEYRPAPHEATPVRGSHPARPIKVGIAGMGAAGQAFVPALLASSGFEWVAFAETEAAVRSRILQRHAVVAHVDLPSLLRQPELDAVIVATPTPLHAAHVASVAAAGLHVLVEKPMAVSLADARAMVTAARQAGVVLLVGHSHSYDPPIHCLQALLRSDELGPVRMVNTWCYSDWMQRPRRPDELDTAQGGGVTYRQGSHQFDIVRLLCGGRARSVLARTFDWSPGRRGIGAHTAFIDFENGASATAVYNGYGGLNSAELCFDISEWGLHQPGGPARAVPSPPLTPQQELQAKRERAGGAIAAAAPHPPFFGLTIVSCERGDVRQSPQGLFVYAGGTRREIEVPLKPGPRERVLTEWRAAIDGSAEPLHDGAWGLANLELCVAAIASSQQGRQVELHEQVAATA